MASKYVKIPPPVTLVDPDSGKRVESVTKPVRFETFVRQCLMLDDAWKADLANLRAQSEIFEALRAAAPKRGDDMLDLPPGSYVKFRVEDHEKLVSVAKNPRNGYQGWHAIFMPQLLPFIEAIVSAVDDVPTTEDAPPRLESVPG